MRYTLDFEITHLDNGITVYGKPADVPFAYAKLCVPVGHVHNTGSVLPGTAHFLEHMVCNRSPLYPNCDEFETFMALKGGDFNAGTSDAWTSYDLDVRADLFTPAFKGLVSHTFEPLLQESDVPNEVSVIGNERWRNEKWYPGDDEADHHMLTKWKYDNMFTIRQIFGEDPDLEAMTVQGLRNFHQCYFDPRAYVVVVGKYDRELVFQELSRFGTSKHSLPEQYEPVRWANRDYHEVTLPDVKRFLYHFGGIFETRDPQVHFAMMFLGNLLVNTVHGVLFNWLRRDLGWCYKMGFKMSVGHSQRPVDWELQLPFSTYEQVNQVRKELHDRIRRAVGDKDLLAIEHERKISSQVFWYQTVKSVLDEADHFLEAYGRILTEDECLGYLNRCKDPQFLEEIYETYWSPQVTGEFLAIPE